METNREQENKRKEKCGNWKLKKRSQKHILTLKKSGSRRKHSDGRARRNPNPNGGKWKRKVGEVNAVSESERVVGLWHFENGLDLVKHESGLFFFPFFLKKKIMKMV